MCIVDVTTKQGVTVTVDMSITGRDLKPGDTYVARRNLAIGWLILTCREVNLDRGYVVPVQQEYYFDLHECFKVVSF